MEEWPQGVADGRLRSTRALTTGWRDAISMVGTDAGVIIVQCERHYRTSEKWTILHFLLPSARFVPEA